MLTNLFTYATKELSQDAFICWLIANYNVEELQKESYRFLNLLMDSDFVVGDIKHMTIKQQVKKIDVVIDFWTSVSKSHDSHYVLVIEDKTTSSAHENQLLNYNKIIDGWNIIEVGFEMRTKKVFLKSNLLSEQDKKEIENANKNTSIKWKKLDINELYKGFFKNAKDNKSDVFNMYIKYFSKLYNDLNFSPTSNPTSWNFNNWRTFFESFFREEYEKKYPGSTCQTSIYRGMYPSLLVNYSLIDNEFEATFEIIPRINWFELKPYLHPGFRYRHPKDGDRWVWSIKEIRDNDDFKKTSEMRLASLREYVSMNGRGMFRYSDKSSSFAKIDRGRSISFDGITVNQLKEELRVWLDAFFNVLYEYKKEL